LKDGKKHNLFIIIFNWAIASDTDLLLAHYMRSLVLLWLVSTCCLGWKFIRMLIWKLKYWTLLLLLLFNKGLLFAAFGVPYGVLMAVLCGLLEVWT